MKNIRKIVCAAMVLCLAVSCIAVASAQGNTYHVGELQLVQHPALDSATQGFEDALKAKMAESGDTVEFDFVNASGEVSNCSLAASTFVANGVDLIFCNATAPVNACATATETIPIIGTAVTDYPSATGIALQEDGSTGINVSGTCDLAPLDQQAAQIKELFPDCQKVGILYCSGEDNSVYQVKVITGYLEELGCEVKPFAFTDAADIAAVTQSACDYSDVIFVPTDNTAAANTDAIANVVLAAKVPVVASESGICSGCGVATLSIDYYDIGYTSGEMAYEVLVNGADVSTMPIQYAPAVTKKYNPDMCAEFGLTVPEDYVSLND